MTCPRFVLTAAGLILASAMLSGQQKPAPKPAPAAAGPTLVIDTVKGAIEVELFAADAPKSVAHIVALANNGFYRGQRFHWATPGVIQFGDPLSRDMTKEQAWGLGGSGPRGSIKPLRVVEISKRPFVRGSVGYAYPRDEKPENVDSQLFILTAPNPALNGKYAQVGRVTKGIAVADKIEKGDTIKTLTVK
jgi:cyclophilin family peptidyl-prolyl cis-trans isomerase